MYREGFAYFARVLISSGEEIYSIIFKYNSVSPLKTFTKVFSLKFLVFQVQAEVNPETSEEESSYPDFVQTVIVKRNSVGGVKVLIFYQRNDSP